MGNRTRHVAIVTDPVTGEEHELTAVSAAQLDQLVDDHLHAAYPLTEPDQSGASPIHPVKGVRSP